MVEGRARGQNSIQVERLQREYDELSQDRDFQRDRANHAQEQLARS